MKITVKNVASYAVVIGSAAFPVPSGGIAEVDDADAGVQVLLERGVLVRFTVPPPAPNPEPPPTPAEVEARFNRLAEQLAALQSAQGQNDSRQDNAIANAATSSDLVGERRERSEADAAHSRDIAANTEHLATLAQELATLRQAARENTVTTERLTALEQAIETAKNQAIDTYKVKDARDDNQSPSWYRRTYPRRSVEEFKKSSALGLTASGGGFVYLHTAVKWQDSSGGAVHQTALGDNGKRFIRHSVADSWSAWAELETVTGAQNKANTAQEAAVAAQTAAQAAQQTATAAQSSATEAQQTAQGAQQTAGTAQQAAQSAQSAANAAQQKAQAAETAAENAQVAASNAAEAAGQAQTALTAERSLREQADTELRQQLEQLREQAGSNTAATDHNPNLIYPPSNQQGQFVQESNGTLSVWSNHVVTDYISVIGGQSYIVISSPSADRLRYAWYDRNRGFISGRLLVGNTHKDTLTAPPNAAFVRISGGVGNNVAAFSLYQQNP